MSKPVKTAFCGLFVGLAATTLFFMGRGQISPFLEDGSPSFQTESDRLELMRMETARRVEKTELLVSALVEGRSPLGEAAQEFLNIHKGTPAFQFLHPRLHESASLFESASRDMATRAVYRETNLGKRDELAARLEAEFQKLFPDAQPLHLLSMLGGKVQQSTPAVPDSDQKQPPQEKIPYLD